jgi:hypothetical protein
MSLFNRTHPSQQKPIDRSIDQAPLRFHDGPLSSSSPSSPSCSPSSPPSWETAATPTTFAVFIAEPTFAVGGEARLEELVGVARNELTNKVAAVGVKKLTDLVAGEAFEEASLSLAGAGAGA